MGRDHKGPYGWSPDSAHSGSYIGQRSIVPGDGSFCAGFIVGSTAIPAELIDRASSYPLRKGGNEERNAFRSGTVVWHRIASSESSRLADRSSQASRKYASSATGPGAVSIRCAATAG